MTPWNQFDSSCQDNNVGIFLDRLIDAVDCLKQQGAYKAADIDARPGLVLLDLNMPGMDGRKTLEIIKRTTN